MAGPHGLPGLGSQPAVAHRRGPGDHPVTAGPGPEPRPGHRLPGGPLPPGDGPHGSGLRTGGQRPGVQPVRRPGCLGLLADGLGPEGVPGCRDPPGRPVGGPGVGGGADLADRPRPGQPAHRSSCGPDDGIRTASVDPQPEPRRIPSGGHGDTRPDGRLPRCPEGPVAAGGCAGPAGGQYPVRPGPRRGGSRAAHGR